MANNTNGRTIQIKKFDTFADVYNYKGSEGELLYMKANSLFNPSIFSSTGWGNLSCRFNYYK